MSVVKKGYYFGQGAVEFFKKKSVKNSLLLVLAFFLVIGFFFNEYAHSDNGNDDHGTYNIGEVYKEIDELSSSSTGVEGQHSHKSQGFRLADTTGSLLDLTYPQGNENYDAIVSNPNISPGAKLGLLGSTELAIHLAINYRPQVDVSEHMAQEWVPNYDQHASSVYADDPEGGGYQRLQASGIDDLWSITRNIAYVLFVIVFIVAGFMIMFRHKIGGQTMVTVYNTLPNIVIGLVLVTFSFAIVGLIIDIGGVLINVIASFLDIETRMGADRVDPTSPLGIWTTYMDFVGGQLRDFSGLGGFVDGFMDMLGAVADFFLSALMGSLMMLVASILVAYVSIKIFITLLKAYVGILFDTVAAPIVLAIATIPGKQGMIKDWLNRVFKNVGTFVLVFLLINLPLFLWQGPYEFDMFGSDLTADTIEAQNWAVVRNMVSVSLGIYLLFIAGNAQKILEGWFPQTGGKGGAGAAEGAMGDLKKTPGIGGFFGK